MGLCLGLPHLKVKEARVYCVVLTQLLKAPLGVSACFGFLGWFLGICL